MKRIPRSLIVFGILLCLWGSLCCSPITFIGSYPGSRLVSHLVDKPAPTLLRTARLVLPASALVRKFDYTRNFMGDGLTLTFDVSEDEALAFIRQGPLTSVAWERRDDPIFREMWRSGTPQPPYRTAQVQPKPHEFLKVDVEERKDDLWTVWVQWDDE